MGVPIACRLSNGFTQLLPTVKALSVKSERTQIFPPGFDQIQIGCIPGLVEVVDFSISNLDRSSKVGEDMVLTLQLELSVHNGLTGTP